MATYTVKGTASSKTSGATLTTATKTFTPGSMALITSAYDDVQSHPNTVKWGNRLLANRPAAATRSPGTPDIAISLWLVPRVKRSTSHVPTATWTGSIVERVMALGQIDGKNRIDLAAGNNDTVTTANPTTGLTGALGSDDDFALAIFASEGPSSDTAGTLQIKDGGSWTNATGTQRIGTIGAPPASNVTLQTGWLQLTSSQATEARIQSATSRLWASAIVTFEEAQDLRQGITPSDILQVEQIFEDHSPALDPDDAAYVYSPVEDRYEAFDLNDMATRIAYFDGSGWIAG